MSAIQDLLSNIRSVLQMPHLGSSIAQRQAAPGLYHYEHRGQGERSRIHLRVDQDGSGLLLVNANRVMHLNSTAAFMAHLALEQVAEEQAIGALRQTYHVSLDQARQDYSDFKAKLDELIRPGGACPVHDLDLEITAPFSARPSAPYRMDLALTYRCNNDCAHCYNARARDFGELDTQAWFDILDRLWDQAIPHVVFTGGEPTLREDLPDLIAHAESNGQITGLNTNGRRLSDRRYAETLVQAGLDHVQITLESHDSEIHDHMVRRKGAWKQTVAGVRNALGDPIVRHDQYDHAAG